MLTTSMAFNVLVKEEDGLWTAHCLELDIVAVEKDSEAVEQEMVDLIMAQVGFALAHENLSNLYRPAPREVWEEFLRCKESKERRRAPTKRQDIPKEIAEFYFPEIITNTCISPKVCHV
jgi:hypothetical protein